MELAPRKKALYKQYGRYIIALRSGGYNKYTIARGAKLTDAEYFRIVRHEKQIEQEILSVYGSLENPSEWGKE